MQNDNSQDQLMSRDLDDIDSLVVNTIRRLAADAVEAARSGHPGTSMGLAPVLYTLWQSFLRLRPRQPDLVQP